MIFLKSENLVRIPATVTVLIMKLISEFTCPCVLINGMCRLFIKVTLSDMILSYSYLRMSFNSDTILFKICAEVIHCAILCEWVYQAYSQYSCDTVEKGWPLSGNVRLHYVYSRIQTRWIYMLRNVSESHFNRNDPDLWS